MNKKLSLKSSLLGNEHFRWNVDLSKPKISLDFLQKKAQNLVVYAD